MNDITNLSAAVASTASARPLAALEQPQAAAASQTPILAGKNLTVSNALSDIEKLVAKIETESADARESVAKMRINAVLTLLEGMNVNLTAEQSEAFAQILELGEQSNVLEGELAELYTKYGITDSTLSSVIMDAKIKSLERAVERAVQEGKDHLENVEKAKELRESDQESEKVTELKAQLETAKADKARIADLESEISSISAQIDEATAAIGEKALANIAAALEAKANTDDVTFDEKPKSAAELEKDALKEVQTNPLKAIREALERQDEVVLDTIGENRELKA